jgi:hypothetical protein
MGGSSPAAASGGTQDDRLQSQRLTMSGFLPNLTLASLPDTSV